MTTSNSRGVRPDVPDIRPHRPRFRTIDIEIQRSTVTGDWVPVALAEDPEWAYRIAHALSWLEQNPAPIYFSEAG